MARAGSTPGLAEERAEAPLLTAEGPPGGRAWWLKAKDGPRIRVGLWPQPEAGHGTVLLFPGRTEFIEKYALTAQELAARGWGTLAVDWRGQGLADRALADIRVGHVEDFAEYQADLRMVLGFAARQGLGAMPWLAHSMGGAIALRAMVDGLRPPAVAFSAPMWGLAETPLRQAVLGLVARGMRRFGRGGDYLPGTGPDYGLVGMAFSTNTLTRDPDQFERMLAFTREDARFALGGPSFGWGLAALKETRALQRAALPELPVLVGLGGDERVVDPNVIRELLAHWPSARLQAWPGAKHELMMESPALRAELLSEAAAMFDVARGL